MTLKAGLALDWGKGLGRAGMIVIKGII